MNNTALQQPIPENQLADTQTESPKVIPDIITESSEETLVSPSKNREQAMNYMHQLRAQAGLVFGFFVATQLNSPIRRNSDLLAVNVAICEMEEIVTFFKITSIYCESQNHEQTNIHLENTLQLQMKLNEALFGCDLNREEGLTENIEKFINRSKNLLALQNMPTTSKEILQDEIRNFYLFFTQTFDPKCKQAMTTLERLNTIEKSNIQNHITKKIRKATQGAHLILSLAIKSKLIALNASIEAAKISEHGKSFAVIARELQSLSLESSEVSKKAQEALEELSLILDQA